MTCKDCFHYKACKDTYEMCFELDSFDKSIEMQNYDNMLDYCKLFKDKDKVIELPCKVGDTVWFRDLTTGTIKELIITEEGCTAFWVKDNANKMLMYFASDIGKTVFLTKEEAEKALKELKE